jgi:hypothetical protein
LNQLSVAKLLLDYFDELGVVGVLGGSMASSLIGEPQALPEDPHLRAGAGTSSLRLDTCGSQPGFQLGNPPLGGFDEVAVVNKHVAHRCHDNNSVVAYVDAEAA